MTKWIPPKGVVNLSGKTWDPTKKVSESKSVPKPKFKPTEVGKEYDNGRN